MEDGAKEEPAQCKEPKFLGKAGGLKKATGRVLASYKDRYIHVEKTELVVYENEDLQNCLERLDLENYDKCHELKSTFKKKHRLILIRSPKSGNKVHDIKLQAQSAEEKEAWIKALRDGINRAKNKVFDEVTVDESSNLEHVTRTRPKGNRNRRPPTRIHMKEVALDLDLEGASMPNGTHPASVAGTETSKEAIQVQMPASNDSEATEKQSGQSAEEGQNKPEVSPQKKVIKPPMPPTKEAKPIESTEDEPDKDDSPVKKVKPPMPPSKEVKPVVSSVEVTEKDKVETISEKTYDAKKTGPPPTPPNKPSSSSTTCSLTETSQPRPSTHQPTPPSKEKKPSHHAVEPDQEVQGTTDKDKDKENNKKEPKESAVKTVEAGQSVTEEALPSVKDDEPESPGTKGQVSEGSGETISGGINKSSDNEPQAPTEKLKKSPSPPPTPKKKPEKLVQPNTQHIEDKTTVRYSIEEQDPASLQAASETSASSPEADEALPKSEVPPVVVSLGDPVTDSLSLSPLLCHLDGEKKKKSEEKSVDSGQHSDDDSDGSGSEDTLAVSTAALRGSHPGLDVLDASEDKIQISVTLRPTQAATKSQVRSKVFPYRRSEHIPPLKPSSKARSASSGDLLSDSSVCIQVRQLPEAVAEKDRAPRDDVMKLEAEVALEMEKTNKLLSKVSQSQRGGDGEDMPEDLLAEAMEKLKQADHVLREVKKLKCANNSSNRKSW
ncbi:Pleckstrin homology domain-containing family O member 2 [Larimichthys crocea]|uniref:Uncharacterized protein n=1 Tax=Larimichthys crocea TaxID=215358 RepID=A0ACD3R2R9_LARCR|nr:Pleckstrin homology domain-containing family O member 2 [Larimichthys crocea]